MDYILPCVLPRHTNMSTYRTKHKELDTEQQRENIPEQNTGLISVLPFSHNNNLHTKFSGRNGLKEKAVMASEKVNLLTLVPVSAFQIVMVLGEIRTANRSRQESYSSARRSTIAAHPLSVPPTNSHWLLATGYPPSACCPRRS